jgi:hypothetical protein
MPFLLSCCKRGSTDASSGIDTGVDMRFSRQWDLRNEIDPRTTPLHGSFVLIFMFILIYLLTAIGLTRVAVIQYTFTQKQCTEQHNETEYPERNIHNNNYT